MNVKKSYTPLNLGYCRYMQGMVLRLIFYVESLLAPSGDPGNGKTQKRRDLD